MSGVSRFLSKRDKAHKHHSLSAVLSGHGHDGSKSASTSTSTIGQSSGTFDKTSPTDFYGLFNDTSKSASKDEESKIKTIKQKLLDSKGVMLKDGQVLWALRSQVSKGGSDASYDLLVAMSDSSEGLLTSFDPTSKLAGAINRQGVTCFLDATLFSMFSRLDSFEAMLYNSFDDTARQRLAFLLRLWVNMLRSGQLITTDITSEIQLSLADCGWEDAKELQQQDASEAFTFITEKLNLPLLTLKMDIYHTGRQDTDDHRFINERLLEVALPTLENGEHRNEVKLEDCLEEYFNNRIEVKRYLERRNTLQSTRSNDKAFEAGMAVHVETMELDPDASTPTTPMSPMPVQAPERPTTRHRAPSIIQERYISEKYDSPMNDPKTPLGRLRTGSVKKEVLMPAWQFFSLIPWYTDNAPTSDAQVAAHFSSKRPVLGLCLKRYSYTNQGRAIRLQTYVDIPIEIALPHFIQDDKMDDGGPLYGNFKLSLQSVVCHRGTSVDSGHYIALVRTIVAAKGSDQPEISHWLRFDDLAAPRVSLVDIQKALREETPYLLFYQILPVEGDPGNLTSGEQAPPSYAATETFKSDNSGDPLVAVSSVDETPILERPSTDGRSEKASDDNDRRPSSISFMEHMPTPERKPERTSLDVNREPMPPLLHRKSGSFGDGLTKTFSKLSARPKRDSKDENPVQVIEGIDAGPHIHIDEVQSRAGPGTIAYDTARSRSEPGLISTQPQTQPMTNPGLGRSRSKREKSRSRLLKSGKGRGEDPDRECVVM